MVMCASIKEEGNEQCEILRPEEGTKVGDRIYLDGIQLKDEVLDPLSANQLTKLFPHFKTDAEGYATFAGKRLRTDAGLIKASTLKNAIVS